MCATLACVHHETDTPRRLTKSMDVRNCAPGRPFDRPHSIVQPNSCTASSHGVVVSLGKPCFFLLWDGTISVDISCCDDVFVVGCSLSIVSNNRSTRPFLLPLMSVMMPSPNFPRNAEKNVKPVKKSSGNIRRSAL